MILRPSAVFALAVALTACAGEADRPAATPANAGDERTSAEAPGEAPVATPRPGGDASTVPDFRLNLDPGAHRIRVEVGLEPAGPDTIQLQFRTDWGGYPGLESRVRSVEAWSGAGSLPALTAADEPGRYRIPTGGGDRVTVTFSLRLSPPSQTQMYHRASQLGPAGGHIIARDMLPLVWLASSGGRAAPRARIWFTGLPSSWRVATVTPRAGNAYAVDDIRDAVFAVGRLRTRQFNIGARAVTVAVAGEWRVADDVIFAALEGIAGNLHGIAEDGWRSGPHLILAGRVPAGPAGLATGGQVIARSGLIYVGGDWPGTLAYDRWLLTAAHELMHWYIPTAFRFSERPPSWFAEGFNEYMSLKVLLAGGLLTPAAFLREMGERIARYRSSPLYGRTSMAEAQSDFWQESAYRFIYDGGAAAAFLLDLGFQDRRASLERALRRLQRAGTVDEGRIVDELSTVRENEWIEGWVAAGTNPDWEARLQRYGLTWSGEDLVATDPWATDVLSTIRP